jgi:hypothetical protein
MSFLAKTRTFILVPEKQIKISIDSKKALTKSAFPTNNIVLFFTNKPLRIGATPAARVRHWEGAESPVRGK